MALTGLDGSLKAKTEGKLMTHINENYSIINIYPLKLLPTFKIFTHFKNTTQADNDELLNLSDYIPKTKIIKILLNFWQVLFKTKTLSILLKTT